MILLLLLLLLSRRRLLLLSLLLVDLLDCAELLLELHAPVLEPDLDLAFRKPQSVSDLDPPPSREVAVEVELLLQLQSLVTRVSLAAASSRTTIRT